MIPTLGVEVAALPVSHDGVDRLPADGDRPAPRRTQGEQQGQAEADDAREPASRARRSLVNELESTLPAERHAAVKGQRSLLEAAVSAALPAPFVPVASVPDREGLG